MRELRAPNVLLVLLRHGVGGHSSGGDAVGGRVDRLQAVSQRLRASDHGQRAVRVREVQGEVRGDLACAQAGATGLRGDGVGAVVTRRYDDLQTNNTQNRLIFYSDRVSMFRC